MPIRGGFEDGRAVTYQARCDIGFHADAEAWREEIALFSEDSLTIAGHPVMERWEDEYMRELAAISTHNAGDILEVGFGMGISAEYIQSHKISSHTIIEANRDVYEILKHFSEESVRPTIPLFGFWQEVVSTLRSDSFDGILFDTYPLSEREIHKNHFDFFTEAFRLLRPGGILTYYSDEIEDFSNEHRAKLEDAGFVRISKKVCEVRPPKDCQYWTSETIVAPIITR